MSDGIKTGTASSFTSLDSVAIEELAVLLRKVRRKKGLKLEEAEAATKINKKYLHMIEQGQACDINPKVFLFGCIHHYANWLGLDGQKTVDALKRSGSLPNNTRRSFLGSAYSFLYTEDEGQWQPSTSILLGCILALIVIYSVWFFGFYGGHENSAHYKMLVEQNQLVLPKEDLDVLSPRLQ